MCHSLFLSGFAYFVVVIRALPASEVSFQVDNFTVFQLFGWMTHPSLCKLKSLSKLLTLCLVQSRSYPLTSVMMYQSSLDSVCTELSLPLLQRFPFMHIHEDIALANRVTTFSCNMLENFFFSPSGILFWFKFFCERNFHL